MTRIGKQTFFLILFFAFLVFPGAHAQEVTVEAALTETNIFAGEAVRLNLKVSGRSINSIRQPEIPQMDGLRWLSNNTSTSQNISYINGRPSVSYTYGYTFIAQKPGTYTFPALNLSVNGEEFTTKTLTYKVLDPATVDKGTAERSPDIYVRLEPSTTRPVVGEQVIADIVLYFKDVIEVTSYQPSPGWKAEGFWKEELENRQRAQTTSTIINGVRYQRARLLQYAVFPTKSGNLELSPFEITVQVNRRNRRRDFFAFGGERMDLSTIPVEIEVQPVPEVQSALFSGAVGDFSISRSMSPSKAYVGESIEVVTTITGTGNVPLILKPEYEYPEGLEIYNPQETSNITRSNQRIGGTKIFTDILIGRNEGNFTVPEARLAVYDPKSDRYRITELPELEIIVERDPNARATAGEQELRFDVRPVTGLTTWRTPVELPLYQRPLIWTLLIVPVIVLFAGYGYKQYRDRMNTDTAFARSRTARDTAEALLKQADSAGDVKTGYRILSKALIGFITDKLDLPPAGMSNDQLRDALTDKADRSLAQDVKRLLDKCDTISYAPDADMAGLQKDLEKTRTVIKELGKQL